MTQAGDLVADLLAHYGVRRAYTVPGESFLPVLDGIERHPDIQLISTRHESGAAFMAEADAKLTGVPAVAMATRAVGAANLAIGVHTAYQDSTPMIVLVGQVPTTFLGREAFQEVDLPRFFGEITKWGATASSADQLPELLSRAWQIATTGRPGPVVIALPSDVLECDVTAPAVTAPVTRRTAPSAEAIAEAAEILNEAAAPVIVAGAGAQGCRDDLIRLAERTGSAVYAAFRRQDVFPNDHPNYAGHLTLGTGPSVLEALRGADVVLVLGSRLSEVTSQGYTLPRPGQAVCIIDVNPAAVPSWIDVAAVVTSDVGLAVKALIDRVRPNESRNAASAHDAYLSSSTPAAVASAAIHPVEVIDLASQIFPADTIVTNDAGNFSVFVHRYWRFNCPRSQLAPTSGAMGYAVPAAVAARLADPDRDVLAFAGDGGFLMTGQEIETAVRYGLPFTTVVFRNGMHGTIAMHQARTLGRLAGVEIGAVDVAAVARGYGAWARTVTTRDELREALADARVSGRTCVIDVLTDPDVLTPTARLSDLLRTDVSAPGEDSR
jgi:acetolactate synthase-1/2/3 large subunit